MRYKPVRPRQCNVRTATTQADQADRRKRLFGIGIVLHVRAAQREHHRAQSVQVAQDTVKVLFGEILESLGALQLQLPMDEGSLAGGKRRIDGFKKFNGSI